MERAYPLQWPAGRPRTPTHKVAASRFDVSAAKAQKEMREEIERMGGRNIVVSTDQRVRRDGEIYARDLKGNVEDSGVAVYFERKGDRVCFACDRYGKIWENMRAAVCYDLINRPILFSIYSVAFHLLRYPIAC